MPIPLVTGALIGGGLGLAKGLMNQSRAKKDAELMATQWRTSPWTGMSPTGAVPRANMLGDIAGGAATGAMFGSMIEGASAAPTGVPVKDSWLRLPLMTQGPDQLELMKQANPEIVSGFLGRT